MPPLIKQILEQQLQKNLSLMHIAAAYKPTNRRYQQMVEDTAERARIIEDYIKENDGI